MPWKSKPIGLEYTNQYTKNYDYIMAIDESGTSSLNDINDDWFVITGLVFSLKNFKFIENEIMSLKNKYWENGMYKGQRVVFHSRDVRRKTGPFSPKIINYDSFLLELVELLRKLPFEIFSSCINKSKLKKKYSNPYDPYEISTEFISERYCFKLNRERKNGIMLIESRNKTMDIKLHNKFINILSNGNNFKKKEFFSNVTGIYYNKKLTDDRLRSYWQLEIADLCSFSIFNSMRASKPDTIYSIIEENFSNYPEYLGRGLKKFP